jgi:hypothetical protein
VSVFGECKREKGLAGDDLLSHQVALAVPSAPWSLTSVFGMGTGVASWLMSPTKISHAKMDGFDAMSPFSGRANA